MTTGGEGGMVTTNDEALWRSMWAYKDHGKSFKAVYEVDHPRGFRWLHESFGTNWRMLEMQAVIGRIQLGRIGNWTSIRVANAKYLESGLAQLCVDDGPLRLPRWGCANSCRGLRGDDSCNQGCIHAFYKFYAYVRPERLANGWTRDRIIDSVNAAGVPCYQGTCSEVYLERAFDGTGWRPPQNLAVAQELGLTSLQFLVHPTLGQAEMDETIEVVSAVLKEATN